MTWKYPRQLAKRFVAPVPSSTKKIIGEISHKYTQVTDSTGVEGIIPF